MVFFGCCDINAHQGRQLFHELDLTEKQKTQLKINKKELNKQLKALGNQMYQKNKELNEEINQVNPNSKKIKKFKKEYILLLEKQMDAKINYFLRSKKMLTLKQREELYKKNY